MKILILGATGGTGRILVTDALTAGHHVTAFVRDRAKLAATHPRLSVVVGDATVRDSVAAAAGGHDAVLSALGSGRSLRSDVASRAAAAIVPALQSAGVRRLIALSAFGVGATYKDASLKQKLFYRTLLRGIFADKLRADDIVRRSDLEWTLVYPVMLTDGPRTSSFRIGERLPMKGMPRISRADVAQFMVAQLTIDIWIRRTVILSM